MWTWAVKNGQKDIVLYLLDSVGSGSNARGGSRNRGQPSQDMSTNLNRALLTTIMNWDLEMLGLLLSYGASANTSCDGQKAPLPLAASQSHRDLSERCSIIKMLVNSGAHPDSCGSDQMTALHCSVDCPEIIRILINEGANVASRDRDGKTPLHYIFSHKRPYFASATLLCEHRGAINERDNNGDTPLLYAVYFCGSAEAVSWLIRHGAEVDSGGRRNPIQTAASFSQLRILALLLDAGADPNFSSTSADTRVPLVHTMYSIGGRFNTVSLLLSRGARPTYSGQSDISPLAGAINADIFRGTEPYVSPLLISEANLIGEPFTSEMLDNAFSKHYIRYHKEAFQCLINAGANLNVPLNEGSTRALILACEFEDISAEEIDYLLRRGADVGLTDECGNTALHAAARTGVIVAIDPLISAGATIGTLNLEGKTPLHCACEPFRYIQLNERPWMERFRRSEMNVRDFVGYYMKQMSFLRLVAKRERHLEMVRRLLDCGASTLAQDGIGATPLHYACKARDLELVQLLLNAPMGKYVLLDNQGRSPLFWAAEHGATAIVKAMSYYANTSDVSTTLAPQSISTIERVYLYGDLVRYTLIKCKDNRGWLPLHAAAAAGREDMVEALLERPDVEPGALDKDGRAALWWAEENNHLGCASRIRTAWRPQSATENTSGHLWASGAAIGVCIITLILVNWTFT